MSTVTSQPQIGARREHLPQSLHRRFEAIVFDWDGTAVPDRRADGALIRHQLEQLITLGVDLAVTSGTHVENIDGQLRARPTGPGHLYFCVNRGSEVYECDASGVRLLHRRQATATEDAALDRAAERTAAALVTQGLTPAPITPRFNRRKVDLLPLPE